MNMKTSPSSSYRLTLAATVLAPVSWGTTYVTITEFLPSGRPFLLAAVRVLPAGLLLMATGFLGSGWRPHGGEWVRTAWLALFNFGLFFPLLIVAIYRMPGGVAAAVGGLQPLLVALFTWSSDGRGPRARDLTIGLVAALGVVLVVAGPGVSFDPVGVAAAVAANVSFAIGVVLTRRFPTPSNRMAATGWQLAMSSLILIPLTALLEGAPPPLNARNLVGFAYLSVITTGVAFVLWFNGIRRLPTTSPPLLGLTAPVTGAAVGWIALGQSLTPLQLAGFVITVSAIVRGVATRGSDERPAPSPRRSPLRCAGPDAPPSPNWVWPMTSVPVSPASTPP
jgi:probable blue pigment (indigoidine) exporter